MGTLGVAGLVDHLGVLAGEARKKRRKKRGKPSCPAPDTCPESGRCCVCKDPTIGCKTFPRSGVPIGCDTLSGTEGSTSDFGMTHVSHEMAACTVPDACTVVRW
jgi:hypothetical protein